jgi:cytochrome b561
MNHPYRYTRTAIGLHWIIAFLVIAAFGLGLIMTSMPGFTPTKLKYFSWHKWLGVTVFIFAVLRVLWRMTHPAPPLIATIPRLQQFVAQVVHVLLYLLIFAAPLSGYLYSTAAGFQVVYLGIIPLPMLINANPELAATLMSVHEILVWSMAALVGLHALGALKHHFVDRDGTLARMLPFLER